LGCPPSRGALLGHGLFDLDPPFGPAPAERRGDTLDLSDALAFGPADAESARELGMSRAVFGQV
jgi:hypothetical protein